MTRPILIDTGPIVAIFSSVDAHHESCIEQLRRIKGSLLTCWPVVAEAAWILRKNPQAVEKFLSSFNGALFQLLPLNEDDMPGIAVILAKYQDLSLQLADASLVHLANRESIETVFTLDRRDFTVLRRVKGKKFNLIP